MYAIFVVGGKQYRAQAGDVLYVEKLKGEACEEVVFDQVLVAGDKIGQPYLEGAKVTGTIEKQGLGKKIVVFKYKSKKNERKKQGHRQAYTKVTVKEIIA